MIVELLLKAIQNITEFVFGLIPNLPPMPDVIQGFGTYLVSLVSNFSQLAVYLYGSVLFVAIVTLSIALLLFDQIWHLVKFVAAKIPLNIK
jgi:hypothetical protein